MHVILQKSMFENVLVIYNLFRFKISFYVRNLGDINKYLPIFLGVKIRSLTLTNWTLSMQIA